MEEAIGKTKLFVGIWGILLAALAVSILLTGLGHPRVAVFLIFGIAVAKASLVMAYYMGLAHEPRYITLILAGSLFFIFVLFVGLIPDIIYVFGK
ncbi:MAG: cytochrome C oxidase subunit IV family protein [Deltaproteobacteria bacterium]|nr:cytochrome C oxidase subunit IV family protein [Deltaproteobacteria bacterium]